jgi:hypothetical protein
MTRPRILAVWELGANLGHVAKITKVVERLSGEADLYIALIEPWLLRKFEIGFDAVELPAPYAPTRRLREGEDPAANYSGILLTQGWDDQDKLSGLVRAWRGLFDTVRPDVLFVQSAPTALLAARGQKFKTVVLGGGYDNPPLAEPMPLFFASANPDHERLRAIAERQEAEVLHNANSVLENIGAPPADRFCDMLRADLSILACWPFNDHYGERKKIETNHAPYIGPISVTSSGARYDWIKPSGAKILAYLRPGTKPGTTGLRALAGLAERHDVICAAPGLTRKSQDQLRDFGVRIEDGPICLDPLLADCDLGISHSPGISSVFVANGIRQLGLPNHREQAMFTRTLASYGLCVGIERHLGPNAVIQQAESLLADTASLTRVKEAADYISKHFAPDPSNVAAEMIRGLLR